MLTEPRFGFGLRIADSTSDGPDLRSVSCCSTLRHQEAARPPLLLCFLLHSAILRNRDLRTLFNPRKHAGSHSLAAVIGRFDFLCNAESRFFVGGILLYLVLLRNDLRPPRADPRPLPARSRRIVPVAEEALVFEPAAFAHSAARLHPASE